MTVCVCCVCCAKSLQLCLTLCDPREESHPGSSVHGTLQARVLQWVAMPSSRGSSQPRGPTASLISLHWQVCSLPLAPPGQGVRKTQKIGQHLRTNKGKTLLPPCRVKG